MKAEQAEIKNLLMMLYQSKKTISEAYEQQIEMMEQRKKDDEKIRQLKQKRGLL
jgi:hypothetical protein